MIDRFGLYYHTIKYMKPSQVYHRTLKAIKKKLAAYRRSHFSTDHSKINTRVKYILPELDFDPSFLARFNTDEILQNIFTFLHNTKELDLSTAWNDRTIPQLWRYNLHYFEYIYPLGKLYQAEGNEKYYTKFKELINCWIDNNSGFAGDGWHPYTISLRLPNWICGYQLFEDKICIDEAFKNKLVDSIYTQYGYLMGNLEKDVLGNHYFENIKALIIGSIFFEEEKILSFSVKELKKQLGEQILSDGMHFELSPMYHKIILEDLIKICYWLNNCKIDIPEEIFPILKKMIDCMYSMEKDTGSVPLFNDSGNNIGKTMESLLAAAEIYFNLKPAHRNAFPQSGYYILQNSNKKLIIDSGNICPDYLPAHGHCDALSYELYVDGKPFIVNSGTYEYQSGKWRNFFRSTKAHNTLMIGNDEQSECWSSFRVARRIYNCSGELINYNGLTLFRGSYYNYKHKRHSRCIFFINPDILVILDKVECKKEEPIRNYIHFHPDYRLDNKDSWQVYKKSQRYAQIYPLNSETQKMDFGNEENGWYSPEFGLKLENHVLEIQSSSDKPYTGYIIHFGNNNISIETKEDSLTIKYDNEMKIIDLTKILL